MPAAAATAGACGTLPSACCRRWRLWRAAKCCRRMQRTHSGEGGHEGEGHREQGHEARHDREVVAPGGEGWHASVALCELQLQRPKPKRRVPPAACTSGIRYCSSLCRASRGRLSTAARLAARCTAARSLTAPRIWCRACWGSSACASRSRRRTSQPGAPPSRCCAPPSWGDSAHAQVVSRGACAAPAANTRFACCCPRSATPGFRRPAPLRAARWAASAAGDLPERAGATAAATGAKAPPAAALSAARGCLLQRRARHCARCPRPHRPPHPLLPTPWGHLCSSPAGRARWRADLLRQEAGAPRSLGASAGVCTPVSLGLAQRAPALAPALNKLAWERLRPLPCSPGGTQSVAAQGSSPGP